MNGDDLLSELRQEVRSYADAREVGSQALEVFVVRLATALGKRPLVDQAGALSAADRELRSRYVGRPAQS